MNYNENDSLYIIKRSKAKNIINKKNEIKILYFNKINDFIKILIIIIIFVIIYKIDYNSFYLKKSIVISKYYKKFENIRLRYYNNSLFKPYLDNIILLEHVYHKNISKLKNSKANINICMSLNDLYVYPTLISITSVLLNCNKKKTFLTYHILCTPDFTKNSFNILKSLMNDFSSNLEMIFYDMGKNFMDKIDPRLSQSTYYRILTPLFIDVERIIYLDGDTLAFKDLKDMYQTEFNDNYVLGFLDFITHGMDYLGIKSEKYINAGVTLFNLEKIRKDNKMTDLIIFLKNVYLANEDQTLVNYVFYPKIGIMPSKYVIFNFYDQKDIEVYLTRLRIKIDIKELIKALFDPTIIHNVLCFPKIWSKYSQYNPYYTYCAERMDCSCEKYRNLFYNYAKKTNYYEDIINFLENSYYL